MLDIGGKNSELTSSPCCLEFQTPQDINNIYGPHYAKETSGLSHFSSHLLGHKEMRNKKRSAILPFLYYYLTIIPIMT